MVNQSMQEIPTALKAEYPFPSNFHTTRDGHKLHYLDEGKGEVLILVHGNPTWSFFYRNLVKHLSKRFRVIVPDHIGMGLSDHPQDYNYCLENHINNLKELTNSLNISNYSLGVHDWGGAIGLGLATDCPEKLQKLIILNTAAFTTPIISKRIDLLRKGPWSEWMIRRFNGFAWPATFMAVTKKLDKNIKNGYLFPYHDYKSRIATAKFVKDIPMSEDHPSYHTLLNIEKSLPMINCPKLIIWGGKDFCFHDYFYKKWNAIYPDAETMYLKNAGHYVLEDEPLKCLERIEQFL